MLLLRNKIIKKALSLSLISIALTSIKSDILAQAPKSSSNNSTAQKQALNSLDKAIAAFKHGNIDISQFKKAVNETRTSFGSNHAQLAIVLAWLGIIEARMNYTNEAIKNFKQSLSILGKAKNTKDYLKEYALLFLMASENGFVKRDATTDISIYSEAASQLTKADSSNHLNIIFNLAQAQALIYFDTKESLFFAQKAATEATNSTIENELKSKCHKALGDALLSTGQVKQAQFELEKALLLSSDSDFKNLVYDKLAEAYDRQGNLAKAKATKIAQLAMWEKDPGQSQLNLINGLSSIIYFLKDRDPEAALPYMIRYENLCQQNNNLDTKPSEDLAYQYIRLKKWEKAIPLLEKHLENLKQNAHNYGPNYHDFDSATIEAILGNCYSRIGNYQKAAAFFKSAKNIFEPNLSVEFMQNYLDFLSASGNTQEASLIKARLTQKKHHDLQACLGCGRG